MQIDIITLFPEMFSALNESIIGRAQKEEKVKIKVINLREFGVGKRKNCDDAPFGGGAGMVMMVEPIAKAIRLLDQNHTAYRIYTSPKGKTFTQSMAIEFSSLNHIIILCGHYEGLDQRAIDLFFDAEISIGDYVLTGGELPAMVMCDCICRYIDGVISSPSLIAESFSENSLEYPQYTRPADFEGEKVPEILLSGNHAEIDKWRREQSEKLTKKLRPDLINK